MVVTPLYKAIMELCQQDTQLSPFSPAPWRNEPKVHKGCSSPCRRQLSSAAPALPSLGFLIVIQKSNVWRRLEASGCAAALAPVAWGLPGSLGSEHSPWALHTVHATTPHNANKRHKKISARNWEDHDLLQDFYCSFQSLQKHHPIMTENKDF